MLSGTRKNLDSLHQFSRFMMHEEPTPAQFGRARAILADAKYEFAKECLANCEAQERVKSLMHKYAPRLRLESSIKAISFSGLPGLHIPVLTVSLHREPESPEYIALKGVKDELFGKVRSAVEQIREYSKLLG